MLPRTIGTSLLLILTLTIAIANAQSTLTAQSRMLTESALAEAFDSGAATIQTLDLPDIVTDTTRVPVVLDDIPITLVLYPHSMRASDYQVYFVARTGTKTRTTPSLPTTVRGTVADHIGSRVIGSLRDGQLTASVLLFEDGPTYSIQPATLVAPLAAPHLHVVMADRDALPLEGTCGNTPTLARAADQPAPPLPPGGSTNAVCEIALEIEYDYFHSIAAGASEPLATALVLADAETIINGVSAIFESQVSVEYQITAIVFESANPATPPPNTSSPPTGLGGTNNNTQTLRRRWNSYHCDINRDVVHQLTDDSFGSLLGQGISASICTLERSYSWGKTTHTMNLSRRIAISAHELGHNWSLQHCNGDPQPCKIMCAQLAQCDPDVTTFGPASVASLNSFKATLTCLDSTTHPPSLQLTSIAPLAAPTLSVPPTTLILTGTGFNGTTLVKLGSLALDHTVTSDTAITVPLPNVSAHPSPTLDTMRLSLTKPCEPEPSAGAFAYTLPTTPVLQAPSAFLGAGDCVVAWQFASMPGENTRLLVSTSGATTTVGGFVILSNAPVNIPTGTLDDLGLGSHEAIVPVSTGMGFVLYSQLITGPLSGPVSGVSPIQTTDFTVPFGSTCSEL